MQRLQLEGVQMLTWWRGSCSGWHGSCWQLGWGLLALRWVGSGGQLPTGQLKVLTEGCGALFGATAIATAWVPSTVAQYVAHHSYGPIMVCTRWNIVCVCLFVVCVGVRGVSNAHVSLQLRRSRVVRLLCLQHRHSLVITLWLSTGASTLHCDAIQPRSFVHDHAQLHFHNCCAAMLYSMFRLRCQAFSKESRPDARFGTVS